MYHSRLMLAFPVALGSRELVKAGEHELRQRLDQLAHLRLGDGYL